MISLLPVDLYQDLLGTPFQRGARGPEAYDCYGLVIEVYRRMGVTLPDFVSPGTAERMESLISEQSAKWRRVPKSTIGAVITMRLSGIGSHVGIVIARDRFLHASDGPGVCTDRMSLPPFAGNIIGAYVYE